MTARLVLKKLQRQAADLFKRFPRRAEEPSAEADIHSHLGAKVSATGKRVTKTALHPFKSLGDRAAETIADRLVNKVIDKGLAEVDQAAERALQRTVAIVALGLWGATTAAAVSLALSAAVGGQPSLPLHTVPPTLPQRRCPGPPSAPPTTTKGRHRPHLSESSADRRVPRPSPLVLTPRPLRIGGFGLKPSQRGSTSVWPAVPRFTGLPATIRRQFCLPCTSAHLRRLEPTVRQACFSYPADLS